MLSAFLIVLKNHLESGTVMLLFLTSGFWQNRNCWSRSEKFRGNTPQLAEGIAKF